MKLKTKNLKSRKIQDQEKYFRIEKKKIFENQEKYFKMEKNVSESRNVL